MGAEQRQKYKAAMRELSESNLARTALHEAGHAVVGIMLGQNVTSASIRGDLTRLGRVRSRGWANNFAVGGAVASFAQRSARFLAKEEIHEAAACDLAGYAAEAAFLASDIETITKLPALLDACEEQEMDPKEDVPKAWQLCKASAYAMRTGEYPADERAPVKRDERQALRTMQHAWTKLLAFYATPFGRAKTEAVAAALVAHRYLSKRQLDRFLTSWIGRGPQREASNALNYYKRSTTHRRHMRALVAALRAIMSAGPSKPRKRQLCSGTAA